MDLETWFQIHTNVSNFEMVSPQNHMNSQKFFSFLWYTWKLIKIVIFNSVLSKYYITWFYRGNKNVQLFKHLYGLKIRDFCMDLEPCSKVHNLVVIQPNNTKLGQMTNLNMTFYVMVSIYKLDQIWNSPQSPAQPQSGQQNVMFVIHCLISFAMCFHFH